MSGRVASHFKFKSSIIIFMNIKEQIDKIIKSVEYEQNNACTRSFVEMKLHQLLNKYVCECKIIDYTIICDERNNSQFVIENNDIIAYVDWTDIFNQKHKYEVSFQKIIG